jgi:hypothetical protein
MGNHTSQHISRVSKIWGFKTKYANSNGSNQWEMMESTLGDLGKEKSTEKCFDLGGRIERGRESRQ